MLVGYARVSTLDQNPQLQIDALKQAGCERLYVEKASGAHRDRPELRPHSTTCALATRSWFGGSPG
jgi:DNA invertase Pin-like site-specific DNA recombinase